MVTVIVAPRIVGPWFSFGRTGSASARCVNICIVMTLLDWLFTNSVAGDQQHIAI
jgi:hypothetical protein